jgi:prepilin-type processing-associated H-X9-DG protein
LEGDHFTNCSSPRWMDVIQPYVKNTDVHNCPSDPFAPISGTLPNGQPHTLGPNRRYVYQPYSPDGRNVFREADCGDTRRAARMSGDASAATPSTTCIMMVAGFQSPLSTCTPPNNKPLAIIAEPADTVLVAEVQNMGQSADFYRKDLTDPQPTRAVETFPFPALLNRRNNGAILGRHMKLTNVVWVDGHAKAVTLNYLAEINPQVCATTCVMFRFTVDDDRPR